MGKGLPKRSKKANLSFHHMRAQFFNNIFICILNKEVVYVENHLKPSKYCT
jgi:hypothetical protein